ncbi:hypothetical protein GCM10022252_28250 [Streptosporangium oxazolinicum]|uniref:Uncharacterized protein n=1 Tax=Streptosporangium oxazolinicum TaxID=909287 RepID=A0ABP8ATK0_9ACTN
MSDHSMEPPERASGPNGRKVTGVAAVTLPSALSMVASSALAWRAARRGDGDREERGARQHHPRTVTRPGMD